MVARKLRLNVDALAVDSFAISPDAGPRGTVHGEQDPATEIQCTELSGCCFTDWATCQTCGGGPDTNLDPTCGAGETCTVRCVEKE